MPPDPFELTPQEAAASRAWAAALRSGKYKQGHNRLVHTGPDGNTYCCLGVLCDLARFHLVTNALRGPGFKANNGIFYDTMPPLNKVAGVPWTKFPTGPSGFDNMNDVRLLSFSEIADEIDRLVGTAEIVGPSCIPSPL